MQVQPLYVSGPMKFSIRDKNLDTKQAVVALNDTICATISKLIAKSNFEAKMASSHDATSHRD